MLESIKMELKTQYMITNSISPQVIKISIIYKEIKVILVDLLGTSISILKEIFTIIGFMKEFYIMKKLIVYLIMPVI